MSGKAVIFGLMHISGLTTTLHVNAARGYGTLEQRSLLKDLVPECDLYLEASVGVHRNLMAQFTPDLAIGGQQTRLAEYAPVRDGTRSMDFRATYLQEPGLPSFDWLQIVAPYARYEPGGCSRTMAGQPAPGGRCYVYQCVRGVSEMTLEGYDPETRTWRPVVGHVVNAPRLEVIPIRDLLPGLLRARFTGDPAVAMVGVARDST